MEQELEEARAEIGRLKCSLADKELVIKRLSLNDTISPKSILGEGGHVLDHLEDRNKKVEGDLKWKVEQLQNLEEAHEKLREQLRAYKNEWETEKVSMVDEISKLQKSLEEGNRAADELNTQLRLCKEALENEEDRSKRLEEELSEMKAVLENETHEGDFDGKIEVETSETVETGQDEVSDLRESLRVLQIEYKEMENKARKLEVENQELVNSIKLLQEVQIPKAVSAAPSSWVKLKNRLKQIEQSHRESTASLKEKEAEWSSKAERMAYELKRCTTVLKMKDEAIDELKDEIESSNSLLTEMKIQNQELSLMLQMMKSERPDLTESEVTRLIEQLQKEREEKIGIQEELNELREEIEEVREALDMADAELTEQTHEMRELELELENWKSVAGNLERQVTGSTSMRRELEMSLLAQAEVEEMLKLDTEEKEKRIGNLEHQIFLMDQEIRIEEEEEESESEEYEKVSQRMKVDDGEQLQLELLAKEFEEAVIAHIVEEKTYTIESLDDQMTKPVEKHERTVSEDNIITKKNVNEEDVRVRIKSDCIIEERSPVMQLN